MLDWRMGALRDWTSLAANGLSALVRLRWPQELAA